MIKAHYDNLTGAIKGFYPDTIDYVGIPEPFLEITKGEWQECINNPDYIIQAGRLVQKPVDIEELRKNAHAVNTAKHLEFQNKSFPITIMRDNTELPDIVLYFNCTDDTRWNIQSAYDVAKEDEQVYFYDGLGVGDYLSESEMVQAITQFKNRLNPSFVTKGQTKLAINQAITIEQLNSIIENITY